MCRFTAYLGQQELVLQSVLGDPINSLVIQSKHAKECSTGINGDGFGIGWYNQCIGSTPALFKSTLPAWNDENLKNITQKIQSNCFVGHVRASTVGNVAFSNCHPFAYKDLMFMHNGTIEKFMAIKKEVISYISPICLENVHGQTDSEYFFALLCTILGDNIDTLSEKILLEALQQAINIINDIQYKINGKIHSRLNLMITNGKLLFATKFSSETHDKVLSLYYSSTFLNSSDNTPKIFVSSEILNDNESDWNSIPENYYLFVDKSFTTKIAPI